MIDWFSNELTFKTKSRVKRHDFFWGALYKKLSQVCDFLIGMGYIESFGKWVECIKCGKATESYNSSEDAGGTMWCENTVRSRLLLSQNQTVTTKSDSQLQRPTAIIISRNHNGKNKQVRFFGKTVLSEIKRLREENVFQGENEKKGKTSIGSDGMYNGRHVQQLKHEGLFTPKKILVRKKI